MKTACLVLWIMLILVLGIQIQGEQSSTDLSLINRSKQKRSNAVKRTKTKKKQSKKKSENESREKKKEKENNHKFGASCLLGISSLLFIIFQRKSTIQFRRLRLAETICEDDQAIIEQQNQKQKLVYVKGQTKAQELFEEPITKIGSKNLLKIRQQVQVLEWRQKKTNSRKNSMVYYRMQWVTSHRPKSGIKQNNPEFWFMKGETFYNDEVRLGQYKLHYQVLDQCNKKQIHFTPNKKHTKLLKQHYNQNNRKAFIDKNTIYFFPFSEEQQAQNQSLRNQSDIELINQSLGTLRVNFYLYQTGPISAVAQKFQDQQQDICLGSFNIAQYQGLHYNEYLLYRGGLQNIKFLFPQHNILFVSQAHLTKQELFTDQFYKKLKYFVMAQGITFILIFLGFWWTIQEIKGFSNLISSINIYKGSNEYFELILALQASFLFVVLVFVGMKLIYNASNKVNSIIIGLAILFIWFFGTSGNINDF